MKKLVIFVTAFSLSILLSVYLLPPLGVVISACISVVSSAGFIFFKSKPRSRYFISCLGLAIGFIYFFVYSSVFVYPAQKLIGVEKYSTATIISYPEDNFADAMLECDDGPDVHISLLCPNGFPEDTEPGDIISADMFFSETTRYHTGVKLYARAEEIIFTKGYGGIQYFGAVTAERIKNITKDIFPNDTYPFAKALIIGDKAEFYEDPILDFSFKAAGLSHIVAVSGMHLSFILTIPALFIKNRKRFSLAAIPFILFFMAVCGFSPSVCRAGIMHLCICAANLFNREPDDCTSLFTSVFIILLFNPYASASVSLQLSFTSVLGIIMFAGRISKALLKPAKRFPAVIAYIYRVVIVLFTVSVAALIFTAPLCALYFGQILVIAPLVSVFVLSILSFTFCLCILACVLGMVFLPAGAAAASVASVFLRYIMWVARTASELDIASIYTSNLAAVVWLVCTYLIFIAVFLLKRPARSYIIPVCISIAGFCIMTVLPKLTPPDQSMKTTVLDVGQGQCIIVTAADMTAVIDCGSTSGEYAGETAADYLHSQNINSIDVIILTHYHADHVNGVEYLFKSFDVDMLIAPPQEDYTSYDDDIISAASAQESEILYIENDFEIEMGNALLSIYQPLFPTGENERCAAVLCTENNYDILITGDMPAYCELLLLEHAKLPDIEVLIAGHHGSSGSSCSTLLTALKPETAVISVGDNPYGHPSDDTLERFSEYDIAVFRTDLIGHITLN